MSFSAQEITFFTQHRERMHEVAAELSLTPKTSLHDVEVLRQEFGDFGRAVMELVTAQRKSANKLPAHWLLSSEAAQQATPMVVARYRARKIADYVRATPQAPQLVHDVTCSIGTEGAAIVAEGLNYLGSDLAWDRLLMARANVGKKATFMRADALKPAHNAAAIIVADPARRAGGRRIHTPEDLLPPLGDLIAAWPNSPLAIKCAPGLDFSDWDGLVSVVSVDGGVKEACLYSACFADGETREAVMISRDGAIDRITDLDAKPEEVSAGEPGTYIIDPDGAVVRAGLVRHYASREGLWMLDERIAYLTGDRIPAGRSGFEFLELVPLKKLKQALVKHDARSVEILVRGVDVDPDQLRKKLKLKGSTPKSVVITRIGSQGVALICGERTFASKQ